MGAKPKEPEDATDPSRVKAFSRQTIFLCLWKNQIAQQAVVLTPDSDDPAEELSS
jgi:hypothetical protein